MSGLAVGMQIMAYGGSKPISFQQASCESQALEPGITGNFTLDAMSDVTEYVGCNTSSLQSADTIACLRGLSMRQLQHAQEATHRDGPGANIGDQWLPVVDGDVLPDAPSKLIAEGRFANVSATMIGWCEDDGNFFVGTLTSDSDVFQFFHRYLPGMSGENVRKLLALYPVSDFSDNPSVALPAQTYRAGRILRDILFTCQPIHYGQALAKAGNVFLWDQNQTMYDEILASLGGTGYGVIHTSNFAYQFGNLSHYNVDGFPYHPNQSDFALRDRQSSSWASFANFGHPSDVRCGTLKGWQPAFAKKDEVDVYVIGGPHEGLFAEDGPRAGPVFGAQKLRERCAFINSPEIIQQLQY